MTTDPVHAFAAAVGPSDPVVAVGSRSSFAVGGAVVEGTREVRAHAGIVSFEPAEMTVRVQAGTTVDELDAALAPHGQCVALPGGKRTVGGVLAVGRSGVRRLGYGPVRDAVLEIRYVSAAGAVVKAGGPTVKNVSGFDLVRLLVGSLGTLGLIAEVVLRTRPLPAASQWFSREAPDPTAVMLGLYRPSSVLWDGATVSALLEGDPGDVDAQAAAAGLSPCAGPPPLPPHPWSLRPDEVASQAGPFVALVGVGTVYRSDPQPPRPAAPAVVALHRRLKTLFDPAGRLAPGRDVLAA